MKKILQGFAVATLVFGAAATAQATEGWYGRVDGGYSVDATIGGQSDYFDEERDSEGDGGGDYYRRDDIELENDWMAAIGAGHAFANGFRAEGEIAYRTNDADDYGDTTITARSAMINAFYDFNRGGRVQPYVGAGAGYAWVEPDGAEDDSSFAYQGLIGLAIALSERWSVDAGYRYFWVNDLDFQYVDADYEHQAVTLGLRYQFTPPPAPTPPTPPEPPVVAQPPEPPTPPAPVACPAAEFTVYFAWDRSNLDQAALDTIDAAVARARQCNLSAATIIGHTDTSGSSAYNVGLSERRAAVVRDALTTRGIDAALLTTQARGETDLARATRDGEREPLNRRTAVSITFR
ncbi:MAG: OmpA family protein [Hyphomonadaceae bacterium]|nr:OmpA family protein [Hyphomonadaceae bacterium]